jgi:putative lipoic acid-binding regulatory protein
LSGERPPADGPHHPDAREEQRQELELIEAVYDFPGDFSLSVIARNDQAVLDAVMAAVTADGRELRSHQRQASSGGKYVSHRLDVRVGSATEAYGLSARLRAIDGVKTVL